MYPVDVIRVTSPYGERKSDLWHYGVDFGATPANINGNNVKAYRKGIVEVSKDNPDGYGNYVVLNHGDHCSVYCHLDVRKVVVGEEVTEGQIIGFMGNSPTWRNMGTHLHFEIRNVPYGNDFWERVTVNGRTNVPKYCVDPIPYLEGLEDISEWAIEPRAWAMRNDISDGDRPKDPVTREEIWTMLYKYEKAKYLN